MRFIQLLSAATAIAYIAASSPVNEKRLKVLQPRAIEDAATPIASAAKPTKAAPGKKPSAAPEGGAAGGGGGAGGGCAAGGGTAGGGVAGGAAAGNQTVKVGRGQTLGAIAEQFGTGICDIAKASGIADPNLIFEGQTLTIPPPTATPDDTSCLAPAAAPPPIGNCVLGGPDRLTIPSDGLSAELAAKFLGITQEAFATANQAAIAGNSTEKLAGGSIVKVPVCPNSQCTISQGTVKQGDVFDKIAADAGSTTGQILALNPGIDRLSLAIGQTFTLPSNCQNVTGKGSEAGGGAGAGGNATAPPPAKETAAEKRRARHVASRMEME
ncbi:intracellular hyphae protein 1 [Diaporthe helianthi]|uniref:Intracellular hyphae protein 1 n=1 Tax=Diaporthe helianthi TaxID=158607 RepID=A0A2P5I8L4_DIAHE|nr:intracellular hyphae protein 1 [Diaporthe helianthi]